ncbi:MAG: DUF4129 domain-containing protein, partial [Bradymonadaceae bacterium]
WERARDHASEVIEEYDVRPPDPDARAESPDEEVPASIPAETETSGTEGTSDDPQKTIDEILEAPEFGHTEEQWKWVPTYDTGSNSSKRRTPSEGSSTLSGLASLLEVLLWIGAGVAVLGFAYLIVSRVNLEGGGSDTDPSDEWDEEPSVLDIAEPEEEADFELPPDLVRRATEHWEQGAYADSLSLLYRGTIRGLADYHGIDIAPHMTARECTRKVEAAGGPGEYMSELARAWTSTAYAERPPTDREAEALFATWRRHFEGGRG